MRVSLEPVPGVPEFDGKLNDWPGVGAGVGPVPLGTEFCGVLVEVPGAPEGELPEPVLPEPPDVPPCPRASDAEVSRTAVTNTSVFGRMTFLPSRGNARCRPPFRAARPKRSGSSLHEMRMMKRNDLDMIKFDMIELYVDQKILDAEYCAHPSQSDHCQIATRRAR
jgi:hypothetical protein